MTKKIETLAERESRLQASNEFNIACSMEPVTPIDACHAPSEWLDLQESAEAEQSPEWKGKPSWDVAPPEANWLTQDIDGSWGFWVDKPHGPVGSDADIINAICADGSFWSAGFPCYEWNIKNAQRTKSGIIDIRKTLEKRPEAPQQLEDERRKKFVDDLCQGMCDAGSLITDFDTIRDFAYPLYAWLRETDQLKEGE